MREQSMLGGEQRSVRDVSGARRVVEVLAALVFAVFALPVVLVALVVAAISYRSNPLFVHERVGRDGVPFRMAKVRTLPPSTARYAEKHELRAVDMPAVMRVIRRLHLDELPQLWNIVRGDMNFIGPRPEMQFLHDEFAEDFARRRTAVRPGVTGLWQVSVASSGMIWEHPEYDLLYLANRSTGLDAWIGLQTAKKMLFGSTVTYAELRSRLDAEPAELPVGALAVSRTD